MARQGRVLSDQEISRIARLLSSKEMTLKQIAERMQCSRSTVASVNRRLQIRSYLGRKTSWETTTDPSE